VRGTTPERMARAELRVLVGGRGYSERRSLSAESSSSSHIRWGTIVNGAVCPTAIYLFAAHLCTTECVDRSLIALSFSDSRESQATSANEPPSLRAFPRTTSEKCGRAAVDTGVFEGHPIDSGGRAAGVKGAPV
jgi:hypothetical protein